MRVREIIKAPALLLAASIVAFVQCNHEPVKGLEESFTLKVEKQSGTAEPIPIDFLWVVDNSASMCEEQISLARSFRSFTDKLESAFAIDPHLAVTGHDVQCDISASEQIYSSKGVFNTVPAAQFPPACNEHRIRTCFNDSDCANLDCVVRGECNVDDPECTCDGLQGEWTCHKTSTVECAVNPNGSINTYCTRRCTSSEDCRTLFDDPGYVCSEAVHGCLLPPQTAGCPASVPPVIGAENLDLFPCAATIGVNQQGCYKYEQGMNAALMAIDPTGPNPEQSRAFLRDDAYLVIIFISDEDDCSVAKGRSINIEEARDTCALEPTTDQGGPLVPVGHFANRFKSLKQDPSKVIVAAINGDSLSTEPADAAADRAAFIESKGSAKVCFHQSYICSSEIGKADYGARYLALTESFGPNGIFANVCANDDGIGQALDLIADKIVTVLNQVCLPKPILDPAGLVVTRRRGEDETILIEGDGPNSYRILDNVETCAVEGQALPAIAFGDPPSPGEEITITYQGDPFPQ